MGRRTKKGHSKEYNCFKIYLGKDCSKLLTKKNPYCNSLLPLTFKLPLLKIQSALYISSSKYLKQPRFRIPHVYRSIHSSSKKSFILSVSLDVELSLVSYMQQAFQQCQMDAITVIPRYFHNSYGIMESENSHIHKEIHLSLMILAIQWLSHVWLYDPMNYSTPGLHSSYIYGFIYGWDV